MWREADKLRWACSDVEILGGREGTPWGVLRPCHGDPAVPHQHLQRGLPAPGHSASQALLSGTAISGREAQGNGVARGSHSKALAAEREEGKKQFSHKSGSRGLLAQARELEREPVHNAVHYLNCD